MGYANTCSWALSSVGSIIKEQNQKSLTSPTSKHVQKKKNAIPLVGLNAIALYIVQKYPFPV